MRSSLLLAGWVESVFGDLDASDGRMGRGVSAFVVVSCSQLVVDERGQTQWVMLLLAYSM